nr:hypothetical protein [uncultured Thiodictyon sp.]
MDQAQGGLIKPRGNKKEVMARHDNKITYDGRITYGESEDNAARAHHIETGLYGGCFVSTTRSESRAICFATSDYKEDGWVYVLAPDLFGAHGVTSKEYPDPLYPDEQEVSIRAEDCGVIPPGVIANKYEVTADGSRK